jgi:FkbM family methyltransferase
MRWEPESMPNPLISLTAALARWMPDRMRPLLYRYPALARRIREALNRAAPSGIASVEIAAGRLRGVRMALDLQSEKDYWLGTYEPELLEAISALARPGMVAYDLGANIGYITLALAQAVGPTGAVISFEALPANVDRLRQNLGLNDFAWIVRLEHAAVVDEHGEVNFQVGPSHGTGKVAGAAGRGDLHYGEAIRVRGVALDEYIYAETNPAPDLIKMDIEGGEVLALGGMRRTLGEARPLMLVELHGPQAAAAAWGAFTEADYRVCRMAPGFPGVAHLSDLDWKAYILALPDPNRR